MNRQGVWRLSPAYDMSYNHLLATIDGREYKYIICKGTPEHEETNWVRQPCNQLFWGSDFDSERGKNG